MAAPLSPSTSAMGVKQGCVLAPTLFGIFALLLKHAFGTSREGIYLRTRSDGRLFNLARLRAMTKVREALIRDMLFADDPAVATHTQHELQTLMDHFSQACRDFGLTISLKKTNVLGQGTVTPSAITMIMSSKPSISSPTSAPPSLTTSLWTWKSTRKSGRQPQPLRASQHECGPTPS